MNYLDRLLTACLAGPLPPNGITHVEVDHEEACGLLRDGPCTCIPNITVHSSNRVYAIGPDGHVTTSSRTQ